MAFVVSHESHPYSNVVRTFQMFLMEPNACPALENLALTSNSGSPSVVILESRYVNWVTSSTIFPCRMIGASERWFILMCLVFFTLTL